MEGFDGRFLDRPYHSLGLAVGPGVVGLGESMLDAIALAGAPEDVSDPGLRHALIAIDELDAIVGQDGVDLVGHGPHQHLEEGGCGQLGRLAVDAGKDQLRGAIDRDEQEAFPALVAQLGDVDVEVADCVILELLRLLAVSLGQSADPVALQAAVQRRARQMRDHVLQGDVDIIQWQPCLHPQRHDGSFLHR